MQQAGEILKIKQFSSASTEWLDFIVKNRLGLNISDYDMVIGPTADGPINQTIQEIARSYALLTVQEKAQLIELWKPRHFPMQVCILTDKANQQLISTGRDIV